MCSARPGRDVPFVAYVSNQLPIDCACVLAGAIYFEAGNASIAGTAASAPKPIGQLGYQDGKLSSRITGFV